MREGTANPKSTRQTTGSDAGPLRSSGENNGGQAALPDSAGRLPACQDSLAGYHPSKAGNLDLREMTMRLVGGENLSRTEAADFLDALLDRATTDTQIAAALISLTAKGETVDELAGMGEAMRRRATPLHSRHERFLDTAGTGQVLDVQKAGVVQGRNGRGEVTSTHETSVASCSACTGVEPFTISAEDAGIQPRSVSHRRESPAENARVPRAILDGETNGD